LVPVFHE
jgi:hypothetical protein